MLGWLLGHLGTRARIWTALAPTLLLTAYFVGGLLDAPRQLAGLGARPRARGPAVHAAARALAALLLRLADASRLAAAAAIARARRHHHHALAAARARRGRSARAGPSHWAAGSTSRPASATSSTDGWPGTVARCTTAAASSTRRGRARRRHHAARRAHHLPGACRPRSARCWRRCSTRPRRIHRIASPSWGSSFWPSAPSSRPPAGCCMCSAACAPAPCPPCPTDGAPGRPARRSYIDSQPPIRGPPTNSVPGTSAGFQPLTRSPT
jgi:hypothetical protein